MNGELTQSLLENVYIEQCIELEVQALYKYSIVS